MTATGSHPRFLNENEKPTKTHYVILGMSWAGWLFDFYDLMLFSSLLVVMMKDHTLGLTQGASDILLGSSLAATALGGVLFGYLADRFGRKTILSWTILVYSLGAFLCGLASGFFSLLVFRIITGLGVGGEWATGQTLVGETFPARMRARFAAVMQTGAPLGIALAAVVGGFLEPALSKRLGGEWSWRACFFVSVLPALLVVFIRRHMPESDVWLVRRGRREARERGQLAELFATPALRRLFILGLILAITDMSAYWFTYTWMPKYLHDQLGLTMAKAGSWGTWMLITQAGGFIGYLTFGMVADWKGRRTAYTLYSIMWAVGLLPVTLFWEQVAVWPWLALCFMFLVGLGTGNFSGYGPIFAEIFPTKMRSTAMGTAFNLARGVQFLTPMVISIVAAHYKLGGGVALAAFFAVFTGIWVWMLPETRGTLITGD